MKNDEYDLPVFQKNVLSFNVKIGLYAENV